MKNHISNKRISIKQNKDGKYSVFLDGKEVTYNLPKNCKLAGPIEEIVLFDGFRDEAGNNFYIQMFLQKRGWFSIYKKGKHIGKYEPQPDIHHPHEFVAGGGNIAQSDNKKFHQSHLSD